MSTQSEAIEPADLAASKAAEGIEKLQGTGTKKEKQKSFLDALQVFFSSMLPTPDGEPLRPGAAPHASTIEKLKRAVNYSKLELLDSQHEWVYIGDLHAKTVIGLQLEALDKLKAKKPGAVPIEDEELVEFAKTVVSRHRRLLKETKELAAKNPILPRTQEEGQSESQLSDKDEDDKGTWNKTAEAQLLKTELLKFHITLKSNINGESTYPCFNPREKAENPNALAALFRNFYEVHLELVDLAEAEPGQAIQAATGETESLVQNARAAMHQAITSQDTGRLVTNDQSLPPKYQEPERLRKADATSLAALMDHFAQVRLAMSIARIASWRETSYQYRALHRDLRAYVRRILPSENLIEEITNVSPEELLQELYQALNLDKGLLAQDAFNKARQKEGESSAEWQERLTVLLNEYRYSRANNLAPLSVDENGKKGTQEYIYHLKRYTRKELLAKARTVSLLQHHVNFQDLQDVKKIREILHESEFQLRAEELQNSPGKRARDPREPDAALKDVTNTTDIVALIHNTMDQYTMDQRGPKRTKPGNGKGYGKGGAKNAAWNKLTKAQQALFCKELYHGEISKKARLQYLNGQLTHKPTVLKLVQLSAKWGASPKTLRIGDDFERPPYPEWEREITAAIAAGKAEARPNPN